MAALTPSAWATLGATELALGLAGSVMSGSGMFWSGSLADKFTCMQRDLLGEAKRLLEELDLVDAVVETL
ncbi:hypothetical protein M427DRAFT_52495 [Gonapodya prolifera JEL478]|uniref:Uncharacterized protein n=1 Tax=Gonapodya prolifera (strain JEL478) TaxID=1344416 RepID=A0A139AU74_GONPJ|nr:hypothetical protein M427DRAFT_52495 [Gonapodya prolifera JEL478]|eukprot:KXS20254.1 hypothetical protein M427DRAFT_52495 [Gonapodya prolifera JEL478]